MLTEKTGSDLTQAHYDAFAAAGLMTAVGLLADTALTWVNRGSEGAAANLKLADCYRVEFGMAAIFACFVAAVVDLTLRHANSTVILLVAIVGLLAYFTISSGFSRTVKQLEDYEKETPVGTNENQDILKGYKSMRDLVSITTAVIIWLLVSHFILMAGK